MSSQGYLALAWSWNTKFFFTLYMYIDFLFVSILQQPFQIRIHTQYNGLQKKGMHVAYSNIKCIKYI